MLVKKIFKAEARLHAVDKLITNCASCESLHLFLLVSCSKKEQNKEEMLISPKKAHFSNEGAHRAVLSKGQSTVRAITSLWL